MACICGPLLLSSGRATPALIVNEARVLPTQTRLQAQGAGVTYQQACEMEGLKSFQVATFLLNMIILSVLHS